MPAKPSTTSGETKPAATPLALSINDAGQMLGVSRATIYREIGAGRLRKLRARGRTLISVEDARAWLASCVA